MIAAMLAAATVQAQDRHSCRCVYEDGSAAQGETVCLRTRAGYVLARCEMVLNNSSWKILDTPCERLESHRPERSVSPPANG